MKELKDRLNIEEREAMSAKRKRYFLNLTDTATILNCTQSHISDAQIGKSIPLDVYNRIADWMDNWSILRDEDFK